MMAIRIVRLGSPRVQNEGVRIGTVRRPPRGVPKAEFATRDFYDVWYPNLAPSSELVAQALHAESEKQWRDFVRKFKAEMAMPDASRTLDLLAALSQSADMSVGCYCEDEARCHRAVVRELLEARGAKFA
jgi:uncharacterized protein YeaO (DUF488 family)